MHVTEVIDSVKHDSFKVSGKEFSMMHICGNGLSKKLDPCEKAEVVFCLEGSAELSLSGEKLLLSKGSGYLSPAASGVYQLNLTNSSIFRAFVK